MSISWNKKERENKKKEERKKKAEKKQERKENAGKGKSLDDMMAYLDEYGNLTSVPPDPRKKINVDASTIEIGVAKQTESEDPVKTGYISFFNEEKGFGFIEDAASGYRVFVHQSSSRTPLQKGMKVSYEVEKGPRGLTAVNITVA